MKIMAFLNSAFNREFNAADKQSQKQLSDHFRRHRKEIDFILSSDLVDGHDYTEVWDVFKNRSCNWRDTIARIVEYAKSDKSTVSSYRLLESYIHMFLNRFLRSKQRIHELVIYDFMLRYYRSEIAKEKYRKIEEQTFNS
jgi:thiopeptide-type bacteriocin biosynthesis protein